MIAFSVSTPYVFSKINVSKITLRPDTKGILDCIESGNLFGISRRLYNVLEEVTGEEIKCKSASTDCNIPLSLGVPAICIGVNNHFGVHTREEWVEKASIPVGLEIAIRFGKKLLEV